MDSNRRRTSCCNLKFSETRRPKPVCAGDSSDKKYIAISYTYKKSEAADGKFPIRTRPTREKSL
jgi:hypothetical protein